MSDDAREEARAERRKRADAGFGSFASASFTVDEFLAKKHAETEREEARVMSEQTPPTEEDLAGWEALAPHVGWEGFEDGWVEGALLRLIAEVRRLRAEVEEWEARWIGSWSSR